MSLPIGTIETHTGIEYSIETKIGDGATGVVYSARRVDDSPGESELVAVKFYLLPRQTATWDSVMMLWLTQDDEKTWEHECETLAKLRHPGVQEILGWGVVDADAEAKFEDEAKYRVPESGKVKFLVSKMVDGEQLDVWIARICNEAKTATGPKRHDCRTLLLNCLVDILESLRYLHAIEGCQHSDLKADNIRVHAHSNRPILIDFGYSQVFSDDMIEKSPHTRILPLQALDAPEALISEIENEFGKTYDQGERKQLKEILFPGLDIFHFGVLLQDLLGTSNLQLVLRPLDIDFLTLLSNEISAWDNCSQYTAQDLASQIEKLREGYWSAAFATQEREINPGNTSRTIALPEGNILSSDVVAKIIETATFRRLQRLKQLSLVDYVYPRATQSRFDHSLQVYSTAIDFVVSLLHSPRFVRLFDPRSVRLLLASALLHDVNHFPFLHYWQETGLVPPKTELNLFELFISQNVCGDEQSIADILRADGLDPEDVINLLSSGYETLGGDPAIQIIKSILDSGVDVDKLSYVIGDSRATGVPFGLGVDRSILVDTVDVFYHDESEWHMCFSPRAISAVESLLLARFWNFKQIYWHHTNRAAVTMIGSVLRELNSKDALNCEEFVRETIGYSDIDALVLLDKKYEEAFGEPSVLKGLESKRSLLFKRLLSFNVSSGTTQSPGEKRRGRIFTALTKMSDAERMEVCRHLGEELRGLFPSLKSNPKILVDIPGRPLDDQIGATFLVDVDLKGNPTSGLVESPFVNILKEQFLDLTRTIRFFISPLARDEIGQEKIDAHAGAIEDAIENCVNTVRIPAKSTVE